MVLESDTAEHHSLSLETQASGQAGCLSQEMVSMGDFAGSKGRKYLAGTKLG